MEEMQKLVEVAENIGWNVSLELDRCLSAASEYNVELEKWSPAGEDFVFSISCRDMADFVREVSEFYSDFDPDEHVEELVTAKHNGFEGVPRISVLVADSEEIDAMLLELRDAVIDAYMHMEEDENNE